MSFTAKRLAEIQLLITGSAQLYANPASTNTYVQLVVLHNVTTGSVSASLWNVPDVGGATGSPAIANRFATPTITGSDSMILDYGKPGIVLEDENDCIYGAAEALNSITIQIYGFQETA